MEEQNNGKKKGLSTNQIIIIIGFVCLIAVIAAAGFLILQKLNTQPAPAVQQSGNLVIDENNLQEVEDALIQEVADGMFEVNMNTEWSFPNGESASTDAYIANGVSNHYPISFEILINDTEVVYSSTVIPVGKQIKEIKLDTPLEAGTYNAVCYYHLWKEDGTENSSFGVNITLNILK